MIELFGHCGCPDYLLAQAAEAVAKWSRNSVTWTITGALPGYAIDKLRPLYAKAWANLMAVCGVQLRYTEGPADITMGSGWIDGPNGTLAWSELPPGDDRPLQQRYDTGEQWDDAMIVGVAGHEGCHALGLPHGPAGALMAPYFNRKIVTPQDWDIAELRKRYGPPPSPGPGTPPADPGNIVIEISGTEPTVEAISAKNLALRVPRVEGLRIRIPGYKVVPE